jgi:hypothetical protein
MVDTAVTSLTFDSSSRRKFKRAGSDKRFLAFIIKALAQRAMTDAALEHLAVSFAITSPVDEHATKRLVLRSADAAQGWVRYAVHNTVKSFVLKLQLFPYRRGICRGNVRERQRKPMMNLGELASSAKLETTHLKLKGVRLQLPAASLVDLSLENTEFAAGSGHLLARFLSSACCPSLQKLQLSKFRLPNLNKLLIEASALLELSISRGPTMEDS